MCTAEGVMTRSRFFISVLTVLLFFTGSFCIDASVIQGQVNKIHFYNSAGKYADAVEIVRQVDLSCLQGSKKNKAFDQLVKIGDFYVSNNLFDEAEQVYRKVLENGGDGYWFLYNRLSDIDTQKGSLLFSPGNLFGQMGMVFRNFRTGFFLMNSVVRVFFYALLLGFLFSAIALGYRYFPLMSNDVLIRDNGKIDVRKVLMVIAMLMFPVLIMSGWVIYPFLISGFFWGYLKDGEKATIRIMVIVIMLTGLCYSFTRVLENNACSDSFRLAEKIYAGEIKDFSKIQVSDNELKVLIANRIYENRNVEESSLEKALDILLSTENNYSSVRKYNLMGNIYFFLGKINESLNMYRKALAIEPGSNVVLNNFTMALLSSSEPNKERVFTSFTRVYPQIEGLKTKVTGIRCYDGNGSFLWKRLMAPESGNINVYGIIMDVFTGFLVSPLFFFILIFVVYVLFAERMFGNFSESTNCSKCGKIVKLYNVHHSYKMCDECHQLFLIKDVVFLEAKLIKERELQKKDNRQYLMTMLLALLVPGIGFRKRFFWLFPLSMVLIYFAGGFFFYNYTLFTDSFEAPPVFLNIPAITGLILYAAVNIAAVAGDEYGV